MKTLFIQAKQKNLDLNLSKIEIKKLPKKLFLAYSIQYKDLAKQVKTLLKQNNIKITNFKQVLGCSNINTKLPILLISTGNFHALNLYLQSPIIYGLKNNKIIKMPSSEINALKIKRKTALLKFLSAERIGILVTTKPGQENLTLALKLKDKLSKNKEIFIFICNEININQFENFNIDSWINTACPGLAYDNPLIINHTEI